MAKKPTYEELEQKVRNSVQVLKRHEQTEETLRKEHELTKIALDSQLDTFFFFEPFTGKAILWNRTFSDITGYSDEEIAELSERVKSAARETRLLFAMFNNHWQGYAPRNAVGMMKSLELPGKDILMLGEGL